MSEVVVLVLRLVRYLHENDDYDVRDEIRQRMYRIGYHRGTLSYDASGELENQEQQIRDASCDRDLVYLPFSGP